MERGIGALFVGTTLVMAAMDGALAALILAALAGGGTFLVLNGVGKQRGVLNKPLDAIYGRIQAKIQEAVDRAPEKEREALRRAAAKKLEQLQKTQVFDEAWNKRCAALIALGVFANPIVGLGIAGYLVKKTADREGVHVPILNSAPRKTSQDLLLELYDKLAAA